MMKRILLSGVTFAFAITPATRAMNVEQKKNIFSRIGNFPAKKFAKTNLPHITKNHPIKLILSVTALNALGIRAGYKNITLIIDAAMLATITAKWGYNKYKAKHHSKSINLQPAKTDEEIIAEQVAETLSRFPTSSGSSTSTELPIPPAAAPAVAFSSSSAPSMSVAATRPNSSATTVESVGTTSAPTTTTTPSITTTTVTALTSTTTTSAVSNTSSTTSSSSSAPVKPSRITTSSPTTTIPTMVSNTTTQPTPSLQPRQSYLFSPWGFGGQATTMTTAGVKDLPLNIKIPTKPMQYGFTQKPTSQSTSSSTNQEPTAIPNLPKKTAPFISKKAPLAITTTSVSQASVKAAPQITRSVSISDMSTVKSTPLSASSANTPATVLNATTKNTQQVKATAAPQAFTETAARKPSTRRSRYQNSKQGLTRGQLKKQHKEEKLKPVETPSSSTTSVKTPSLLSRVGHFFWRTAQKN